MSDSAARVPHKAFCKGGTQVCEVCVDSCGRSEWLCETEGHEWHEGEDYRTCPRCGETEAKSAAHRYEFWGDQGRHIPLWQRIVFFPLMVVGFWAAALLSVLWLGPGVLREAPIVWWRMVRYGEGRSP